MLIYIASDHRGFKLKEAARAYVQGVGYEIHDLGNTVYDKNDDYPDFAKLVAEKVQQDPENRRGILVCGSGVGVDAVANKFARVRSVLALSPDQVIASKTDDDTNIISIAADYTDEADAKKMVSAWLQTSFSGEERHVRRLQKIADIEWKNSLVKEN